MSFYFAALIASLTTVDEPPPLRGIAGIVASNPAHQRSLRTYENMTAANLGIYSGELRSACEQTFLQLSPSGRYFVAAHDGWRQATSARTSNRLIVVDLDCTARAGEQNCGIVLEALSGLRLVSWSANEDRLYIVEQDSNLVEVTLSFGETVPARATGRMALPPPIGRALSSVDRTASEGLAQEHARILAAFAASANDPYASLHLKGLYLNGTRYVVLREDDETLAVVATVNGEAHQMALPAPLIRQARVGDIEERAAVIYDRGLRVPIGSAPPASADGPYQLPVISSASGRVLAHYAPDRVFPGPSAAQPRLEEMNRRLESSGAEILGLALTESGVAAAALRHRNGSTSIRVHRNEQAVEAHCPSDWRVPIGSTRRLNLGTDERRLDAILTDPPVPSRGLVIFFPGGPSAGLISPDDAYAARQFLALGYSLLAVNYSGTAFSGPEVFERLGERGVEAIREDVQAIMRALPSLGGYADLIVTGTSLGALPALALDNALASAPHRTVLLLPYLRHREPGMWIAHPGRAAYQRRFEARSLGLVDADSIARFQAEMDALQNAPRTAPLFAAFGNADPVARAEDLLRSPAAGDRVITVLGAHDFSISSRRLWSELETWLRGEAR